MSAKPKNTTPKKTKEGVDLTPAQVEAQANLEKANAEARQALIKASEGKLQAADKAISEAENALKKAKEAKKSLIKSLGLKTNNMKKVSILFYVKDYQEDKGAPQARQILEIVKTGGDKGISRVDTVKAMKTVMKTDMDRSRLLSFYCSKMVSDGVIKVA